MKNTIVIQLTNQKAAKLLHELEELQLIKVIRDDAEHVQSKPSEKYKGFISKDEGLHLNDHITQMRSEWSSN